ncbi:MAG: hypothetical protein ACJ716_05980 [Marmoricola sp.]
MRLTGAALGSAIVLQQFPRDHIVSIAEEIEYSWTETRRSVRVNYRLPYLPDQTEAALPTDLEGQSSIPRQRGTSSTSHTEPLAPNELHLLPIAAHHKDEVLSISNLEVHDGKPIRLLSYSERIAATKLMLRALFVIVYADWLADGNEVALKVDLMRRLDQLVESPAKQATTVLGGLFVQLGRREHQLREFPAPPKRRPPGAFEQSFFELCAALATRNLIFAKTVPENPDYCSVSWVMTKANDWQRFRVPRRSRPGRGRWRPSRLWVWVGGRARDWILKVSKPPEHGRLRVYLHPLRWAAVRLRGKAKETPATTGTVNRRPSSGAARKRKGWLDRFARALRNLILKLPERPRRLRPRWLDRVGDGLRGALGDPPKQLRVSAPLARRTADYHLRMEAPPGHYCLEAIPIESPVGKDTRTKSSATLIEIDKADQLEVAYSSAKGTRSSAHVFIRNGVRSWNWLDVNIIWQEIPLGSVGSTALAAILALVPAAFLYYLRAFADKGDGIPATFVATALVASLTPALSMVVGPPRHPSLWARFILLVLALASSWFAVWWAIAAPSAEKLSCTEKVLGGIPTSLILLAALIGLRQSKRTVRAYLNKRRESTRNYTSVEQIP